MYDSPFANSSESLYPYPTDPSKGNDERIFGPRPPFHFGRPPFHHFGRPPFFHRPFFGFGFPFFMPFPRPYPYYPPYPSYQPYPYYPY